MAAICVARPVSGDENAFCRPRILKSTTGWAERVQFQVGPAGEQVRMNCTYNNADSGRYSLPQALHTANSFPRTRSSPTTRNTIIHTNSYKRASVLVADFLESLACTPLPYGSTPLTQNNDVLSIPDYDGPQLARAHIHADTTAPAPHRRKATSPTIYTPTTMDFDIDFGGDSGFRTKPSKKKKPAANKFDPWSTDGNDKKDDTAGNGSTGGGGDGGYGGDGGDAAGAGGGGDDNNGGGNDDDWGFSSVKKGKKKTKKQQQEEEEEERKRKEEEDAKANAGNQDPLSWADDANEANGNDDWGMWGKKDKDKKKKKDAGSDGLPAFQDVNLDDGAPKLDFSFDGIGESKKPEGGGGFSAWGKTWDFGSISKDTKKEEPAELGNNNPWGLGGKSKKKTTMSTGFDFGDFGSADNNDLSFAANDDVADTKPADDAWGFATQAKKDKKKKGGIEEIKEEPVADVESKNDDTWGGWGGAKASKTKKKSAFDDSFAEKPVENTTKEDDTSFDWGFGGSKKKKDPVAEIVEEPAEKANDGDDWMSGAWGAASKKKKDKKKGATDDLSASIDLTSNADSKTVTSDPPADDMWATFTSTKDKKKTKKNFLDDEPLPEAPEPPPANNDGIWGTFGTKSSKKSKGFDFMSEPEEVTEPQQDKEPLVAWDFGLAPKDKRKKEKTMKLEGTWEDRVTQEMVDAAEAEKAAEPPAEDFGEQFVEPEPEPEPAPATGVSEETERLANEVPWDFGLTPVKKRKKEKDMKLDGSWSSRITIEMIEDAKAAVAEAAAAAAALAEQQATQEPEAEPAQKSLADEQPWDFGLDALTRRQRQKELKASGLWESRITQVMIDEAKAAAEEANKPKSFEDDFDPEPIPEPEPEPEPKEERVPWDEGLSPKEKRKKEKDMRAAGTWNDRWTRERIEEEAAAAAAAAEETQKFNEPDPEPEPEQKSDEVERVPWDHGLSAKEKKRVEKSMRLAGTWDSRLTQEQLDEEAAAAAAVAAEPEAEAVPEPEPEAIPEERVPWDHNLSPKEKRKKEKELRLAGLWDERLTSEQLQQEEEEAAAAAAASAKAEFHEEVAPEPERVPWDHNLSPKEKRKKEKELRAAGLWEDRLTSERLEQEAADAAAAQEALDLEKDAQAEDDFLAEPEPEPEPRVAWDHGLNAKEKKKKEKELRAAGMWLDRVTQEQLDEEEAAKAAAASAKEPEPEEPANDGWSFGWGSSKPKSSKKSLVEPEPEKVEEKAEEGWGGSWGFGLKKTKTKTPVEETPPSPPPEPEPENKADDIWSFGATTKAKKREKSTTRKSDLFDPVVEDVEPPAPAEDDIWATFGAKSDKKTSKKTKAKEEAPISPPTIDLDAEEDAEAAIPSVDDFDWGGIGSGRKSNKSLTQEAPTKKSNKSLVEETPARKSGKSLVDEFSAKKSSKSLIEDPPAKKSTKSFLDEEPAKKSSAWGFGTTSSTAKTRKEKEAQAKKEAEEQAQREEEERLQREAEEAEEAAKAEEERIAAEEAAKSSKKTKAGKLSKTSKTEDKKKSGDLLDLLDDPVPTPNSSSSKLKKSSTRGSERQLADLQEEAEPEIASVEPEKDYFGIWGGSSKKTAGKKSGSKKEITTSVLTNEEDALLAELDEDQLQAILDDTIPSSSKTTKTMSNDKTKPSSRIADRIKAFEGGKEDASKKSKQAESRLTKAEPDPEETLSPKEAKKAMKGKSSTPTSAKSSKIKVEDAFSLPVVEPKKSKDSVPGSFPGAFAEEEEEDLLGIDEALRDQDRDSDPEPSPAKSKKKSIKADKKVSKPSKSAKKSTEAAAMDDSIDTPTAKRDIVDDPDLLDDDVTLPTPPPEAEKKTAKKERARVERSANSWGFWGTAAPPPKKLARSQTVNDVSPPSSKKTKSPTVMTRAKSVRTAKNDEADTQKGSEKASKSSTSDKDSAAKAAERPKPSRGLSLTNFMLGGAPPSAMRQSQGAKVRRQSTSSHPVSRSSSRRQSMDQSGILSPPPEEDSPIAKKASKLMGYAAGSSAKRSSTKTKTASYPDPYPIDDDDMVMIRDNGREEEPRSKSKPKNRIVTGVGNAATKPRSKTLSGDEDVVMVDSPLAIDSANDDFVRPALQRSNTGRKAVGILGGLLGFSSRPTVERSRSSPVTDNEDNGLPIRSRASSQKRSRGIDGVVAQGETDTEAAKQADRRARRSARDQTEDEGKQAREQRRRERREREKADLETRREKAREQARKEREAEEQDRQERRARRREKEAAEQARLEREAADAEAAADRRRAERRRQRESAQVESPIYPITKEDRRRTYAGEGEVRRSRKDDRSKSRPTDGFGRRSSVLMAEYHESRSGSGRGVKPPANKTSSWIDRQKDEPPDLPPVEGTVLDESGQAPRPVEDAESDSRRRRKDRYAGMTEEEIAAYRAKRRERRVVEKSTSSDEKTKKDKRRSRYEDDYYADPVRTFDGRPALGRSESKRNSFLGRLFAN